MPVLYRGRAVPKG